MAGRTTSVAFLGNASDLNAVADRVAAKLRETSVVAEQTNAKTAAAAEAASVKMAAAYDKGTTKMAAGLSKVSALGASFGLPMVGSLDAVGKKLDETTAKHQKFVGTLAEAGKVTLLAGGAGLAAVGVAAVKLGEGFQTAQASVESATGVSVASAAKLTSAFGGVAGKFEQSGQAMESAYAGVAGQLKLTEGHALGAGDAMKVMTAATELADGTGGNLASTTSALAGVMQTYHLSVGQAAGASDTLYNVSKGLNVPVDQVAQAVDKLHGRLGALAPSLRDASTLMVEMGQHGITGTRGIMLVNTAFQTLDGGSKPVKALLQGLGVHIYDASGKFVGLQSVISQLQPKFAGMTQQQQMLAAQMLFGKGAAQAMLQVIQGGVSGYQNAAQAASRLGTAHAAAAAQSHTLHGEEQTLSAAVKTLGGDLGLILIPKLAAVAQATVSVIGWFEKHKVAAIALAGTIGSVLGLAVTVFAYTKAVAFVGATKDMLGGISKLAGGIASAVPAILAKLAAIGTASETTAATVEGSNVAAGASFTALDAEVGGAVAVADGQMALFASTVAEEGAAIEATNVAVGASFTAMLGPIGLVAAALGGVTYALANTPANPGPAQWQSIVSKGPGAQGRFNGMTGTLPGQPNSATPAVPGSGIGGMSLSTVMGNAPAATGPGGVWLGAGGQVTPTSFAASVLARLGIPTTSANIKDFTAWEQQEGGNWNNGAKFNPLNTTLGEPGAGNTGSQGNIKVYTSWAQGLQATVDTLKHYPTILAALKSGAPLSQFSSTVAGSPWGTGAITAQGQTLSPSQLAALGMGPGGKSTAPAAAKAIKSLLYANPLPGMTSVGRTDMGVDYSATPGSAVNAIGAGVVDAIIQNWYKGQPLIEEKLTSGPNAGKFVYYAEQIKSLVHVGQQVQAGQRVGTVAPSGTGLELGFGAGGGKTLAQATTGYIEGQQTPAGKAFRQFMQQIGSHGVYTTTTGGVTTGGGTSIASTIQQAIQQFIQGLQKAAGALITTYTTLEQSGTVKTLTKALGVSTGGKTSGRLYSTIEGLDTSKTLASLNAGQDPHALDAALVPILTKASASSPEGKAFAALVAQLKSAGLTDLAKQLVAQHGAAMATLAQDMVAQQTLKDGELLSLQATQLKDQTQLTANTSAAMLNIHKAQTQKMADLMQAQVTYIKDMTQEVQDKFASVVQAIEDATQQMADSSSAVVSGIQDQTQIRVDILGERGLYGLNLIAQQQQVQLDQMKAGYDQQIDAAKLNLDQVTTSVHVGEATAQLNVDQVTLLENHLVAMAQLNSDSVAIAQNVKLAAAQQHMDSVTLHMDASVLGPAQTAVDLGATLPRAQQDLLNGILKRAQGQAGMAEGQAASAYQGVYDSAQRAMDGAAESLARAQGIANTMIGNAQATLATVTGQGNQAIAAANQALTGIQDTAAQAEAALQGTIDVTKATASTQFAGTGTVVNIYGIPANDASRIGDAVSWVARTQLQTA